MTIVAALLGYLLGSIPSAGWLARLKGIDLRHEGSGNPGTKNALGTGGIGLAAAVLVVEATKGYLAVRLGASLADDPGAIVAGIGAVTGNVYNVWYQFEGGKGLGISLGVLAAAWPTVLPLVVGIIVVAVVATRSAGVAALLTMVGLIAAAVVWPIEGWATGGIESGPQLLVLAMGMTVVMAGKHWRDSPLNSAWRDSRRTTASPGHR